MLKDFFKISGEKMAFRFWLAIFFPFSLGVIIPVSVGFFRDVLDVLMNLFAVKIVNKYSLKNLLEHIATVGMIFPFLFLWLPSPSVLYSYAPVFCFFFYLSFLLFSIWVSLLQAKAVKMAYNLKSVGLGLLAVLATKLMFSLAIGVVVFVYLVQN